MNDKERARHAARESVEALSSEIRIVLDAQIATHITHLPFWQDAETIFAYVAMDDEVDLHAVLLSAYRGGKAVALPRIDGDGLSFRAVDRTSFERKEGLELHPYGCLQPHESAPELVPDSSSLVLVPGRQFDRTGVRLGRGGGYYDRFLAGLDHAVPTVGVAYTVQVVRSLPHNSDDVPVAIVLSDSETCFCRRPTLN